VLVRPVGAHAVLLEVVGSTQDCLGVVAGWERALAQLVTDGVLPPPRDVVPGARTLLLDGVDPALVLPILRSLPSTPGQEEPPSGGVVEVPVVYDGDDLAAVAAAWDISEAELITAHTSTEFRVAFTGFAPGFPYLVSAARNGTADLAWDVARDVARHATPRALVPAGAVGLAGRYCGIYPRPSPGGWQLIGTTECTLFDPDREPPALLPPGTRVRFVETTALAPPPGHQDDEPAPSRGTGAPALTVVRAGALTTLQDAGRPGWAHLGVPHSGALDPDAAALANRLVGNPAEATVLETTLDGVSLRSTTDVVVAVTGAPAAITVGGRPAPWGVPVTVRAGEVIDIGAAVTGVRSYLAVAGGLTAPPVLGSRSTDVLSGLGRPPLAVGDDLAVGARFGPVAAVDFTVARRSTEPVVLRLTFGPRDDWFDEGSLTTLRTSVYTVSATSNRIGMRLTGPPLARTHTRELESEGMVLGAVQIPPDGHPVIMLADHPTTGGYPVVGVVDAHDISALAQARPGTRVRFDLNRAAPHHQEMT
jgi:KipI family sensor histidine kinase inhibitor